MLLHWHGFQDVKRGAQRQHANQLESASGEQFAVLRFGAFHSSGQCQHDQVEGLSERGLVARPDDTLDHEQPGRVAVGEIYLMPVPNA